MALAEINAPQDDAQRPHGLRANALGFPTVLAQGVALISPTMTAVLIIPLAFSDAGQGTWLAYAFGAIMLLFVARCLNQFAKRSAAPGSMYSYTARGLGSTPGVLSGWTLIWCYVFIGTAGLTGFAIFAQQFLDAAGVHVTVPPVILFLISASFCWLVAYKDIRISSLLTLFIEALSMTCILVLSAVVLFKHGFSVDTDQVQLKGMGFHGLSLGVVVSVFSLVGFESATALGGEAKRPLINVPRAVRWSLIIAGAFFVIVSYVEVAGTRSYHGSLADLSAPLNTLSQIYGVSFFKIPLSLCAMVSFFSLSLSCLNAGSRIMYPMAQHRVLPPILGRSHPVNRTPHTAVSAYICLMVGVPMILEINTDPLTIFNYAGTLAAFGFLLAYFLITVAAPVYLKKIGELNKTHMAFAVAAFVLLLVPTEGSFYPVPAFPVDLFPYIFVTWVVVGGVWLKIASVRRPGILTEIAADLEASEPHSATVIEPIIDATDAAEGVGHVADAPEGDGTDVGGLKPAY